MPLLRAEAVVEGGARGGRPPAPPGGLQHRPDLPQQRLCLLRFQYWANVSFASLSLQGERLSAGDFFFNPVGKALTSFLGPPKSSRRVQYASASSKAPRSLKCVPRKSNASMASAPSAASSASSRVRLRA
eukprot:1191917-Prorocentrum_minimum.AAC.12